MTNSNTQRLYEYTMLGDFLMIIMAPTLYMEQEKGLIVPNLGILLTVLTEMLLKQNLKEPKEKIQGHNVGDLGAGL